MMNRRDLLKITGTASATVALGRTSWLQLNAAEPSAPAVRAPSWVERPMRWAQLTLVEDDPGNRGTLSSGSINTKGTQS